MDEDTREMLVRHTCPRCGNACPPQQPMVNRPTAREAAESLAMQLRERHDPDCPMDGYPGNYQGYSSHSGSAICICRMRTLYQLRQRLERIYDELDDD